jgi:hypothetical protein
MDRFTPSLRRASLPGAATIAFAIHNDIFRFEVLTKMPLCSYVNPRFEEYGTDETGVLCIGPAGENGVRCRADVVVA